MLKIIVANWKMQGTRAQLAEYFNDLQTAAVSAPFLATREIVICPPFLYLFEAANLLKQTAWVKLGAQDVSAHQPGPFTGQIAAKMLVEQGCQYVIIGHSERRTHLHESNELIAAKFIAAKEAGLIPILCVGETAAQRQRQLTESVIKNQLHAILQHSAHSLQKAILAYEPIWAIGSGQAATPEQAQAVHHLLRTTVAEYDSEVAKNLPILYGGSVTAQNAGALFKMKEIDGVLVGGASLHAPDFLTICQAGIN